MAPPCDLRPRRRPHRRWRVRAAAAVATAAAAAVLGAAASGSSTSPPGAAANALLARVHAPWEEIQGALPAAFAYRYSDSYRGWPVAPVDRQHPIRGSFLDPRGNDNDALSGYHFGVDVNVDDEHPERGAPAGMSHRVYAVESGVASYRLPRAKTCGNRRVEVGHFAYWHVSPTVRPGERVRAGQAIGWTCLGEWHVHLSEWQLLGRARVWVNPLHAGGKLAPYLDTAPPSVAELRFVAPSSRPWQPVVDMTTPDPAVTLPPGRLRGRVELRARIGDPQSFLGFLASDSRFATTFHPYRVAVEIRRAATGRPVLQTITMQSDQIPERTSYLVHFGPGTRQNSSMGECVGPPPAPDCRGIYWFRPFSRFDRQLWDTRRVANGAYRVTVFAWDIRGNVGSRSMTVSVAN